MTDFYKHTIYKASIKMNTISSLYIFTSILLLALVQTGDKSGEVTARMNLSDLRLVVGLKSNSNIYPNIFRNTNTNNSPSPLSYQGYSNFPGTCDSASLSVSGYFYKSVLTCSNSVTLVKRYYCIFIHPLVILNCI